LSQRTQDENDRRSVLATLTGKGSKLLETVIPEHLANELSLLSGLSTAERTELGSLLRKWLTCLEENAEGWLTIR
jgi:DNA-binding MarR family transcriptional regulator